MIQNRYHFRAKTLLIVKVNDKNMGTIVDISAGGIMMATNAPLKEGDLVSLDVELPNYSLKVWGLVARISAQKIYGIQLVNLTNQDKVMITQYIFRQALHEKRVHN